MVGVTYRTRLVPLLTVLAVVALPAIALDIACIGSSCDEPAAASSEVPFCSLPAPLREDLAAGYREQRSPDVLTVPGEPVLWGWDGGGQRGVDPAWPSANDPPSGRVPIVFAGTGVHPNAPIPDGAGLDAVAPTLLEALGSDWAFPGVHPGEPIAITSTERARLVLVVALKGIGSAELEAQPRAWPFLRSLLREGSGTLEGDAGSLPLDPAATLTTIGTGATPADHGITGTWLRNDDRGGALARAWSAEAPLSVIATFADDLEYDGPFAGSARIGLVADDPADLGLVGRDWYAVGDRDEVTLARPGETETATGRLLADGFGGDATPDVLGAVVRDSIPAMDDQLRGIVERARAASGDRLLVSVVGTGSATGPVRGRATIPVDQLIRAADDAVPGEAAAVEWSQPGGLFLDQEALVAAGVGSGTAVQAMLGSRQPDGTALLADAFGGFAVQFGRFC